jgi:hypothetical protein
VNRNRVHVILKLLAEPDRQSRERRMLIRIVRFWRSI